MAKSNTDKISGDRPDLIKLGDFAGSYGFVMNGGTSASALQIYTLQAEQFTGYWSGTKSLDEALESGSEPGPQALRRVATWSGSLASASFRPSPSAARARGVSAPASRPCYPHRLKTCDLGDALGIAYHIVGYFRTTEY